MWAEGSSLSPAEVIESARRFSLDQLFVKCTSIQSDVRTRQCPPRIRWSRPNSGFVKVNFDGTLFAGTGEIDIGVVARNADGEVVGWETNRLPGPLNPEFAESFAAFLAVRLARDFHWRKVEIEGDCFAAIRKLEALEDDSSF